MLALQDQEWLQIWEKVDIVRLMNNLVKGPKKNDGKSAVAMLKRGNWQEREPVTDECHDRPGKPGKRSDKKLGQISCMVERGNPL